MNHSILTMYLTIAGFLFLCGIVLGMVLKKDVLHGGVRLGIVNSMLLAIAWPATIVSIVCGWIYDVEQAWRKL